MYEEFERESKEVVFPGCVRRWLKQVRLSERSSVGDVVMECCD
jgi:hypothetical protein